MKAVLFILGFLISLPSQAEIYKYVDDAGRITYSNLQDRGARKLNLDPPLTPVEKANSPVPRKKTMATPSNFPRVDAGTQSKRDDLRRTVLQDELRIEERNLAEARAAQRAADVLRPGESPGSPAWRARSNQMSEAVRRHENNVAALKKELANIR